MNRPLISVIIPVYNVEDYLKQCVNSVLKQTYKELEIILVDDGSQDASGNICDYYAKVDQRIKVIHKENGGLSSARNVALDVANGEFITFVDSDDYLADDYVEFLYGLLVKNKADISICSMHLFYDDEKNIMLQEDTDDIVVISAIEALKNFLLQKKLFASAWCKLYKKEIFADIRYPIGYYYEDMAVIHKIFMASGKIVISRNEKYFYRQRRDSIMNCNFNIRKMDRIKVAEEIKNDVEAVYPELTPYLEVRCFIANIQTLRELPFETKYKAYKIQIADNIKKYRKTVILCECAKPTTRFMAFVSYLGVNIMKFAGNIYSLVFKKI